MSQKIKSLKEQSEFCLILMKRLKSEIDHVESKWGMIIGHTRLEHDIIKIRRELNILNNMLQLGGYNLDE